MYSKALKLISFALLLAGCGGGGGGDDAASLPTTADPTGIWQGSFTEPGYGTFDLFGIVSSGEGYFISFDANMVYQGRYSMSGSSITSATTGYEINGGVMNTAQLSGTVVSGRSITANSATSYGTTASIALAYSDLTDRGSSLDRTSGVWSASDGYYTVTITIDPDGSLYGSDTSGCGYAGRVSVIDPAKNIYRIDLSVTACGVLTGSYDGYGLLSDAYGTNDQFSYVVANSNYLMFGYGLK